LSLALGDCKTLEESGNLVLNTLAVVEDLATVYLLTTAVVAYLLLVVCLRPAGAIGFHRVKNTAQ